MNHRDPAPTRLTDAELTPLSTEALALAYVNAIHELEESEAEANSLHKAYKEACRELETVGDNLARVKNCLLERLR